MSSLDDLDASDKLLADLEKSKQRVAEKQREAAYKAALAEIERQAEIIGLPDRPQAKAATTSPRGP